MCVMSVEYMYGTCIVYVMGGCSEYMYGTYVLGTCAGCIFCMQRFVQYCMS